MKEDVSFGSWHDIWINEDKQFSLYFKIKSPFVA